jgi:hypothetical protein
MVKITVQGHELTIDIVWMMFILCISFAGSREIIKEVTMTMQQSRCTV